MTPERWQRVDEIFQAAIELKAQERPAFVASACVGDEELRREVESLITADEQGLSFVDEPAFQAAASLLATGEPQLAEGQSISHYEIIGPIGRGGMGEVYLAKDKLLNRPIALKLLLGDYTRLKDRLRRFQQEAQAASALNHPNILTIYELGQVNEQQFIATEFVEGETLRQRMKRTSLAQSEALDIASQMASALSAAHRAGIVHRDIKPENIMLRPDGYVKVLDFGLAKLTQQEERPSETIQTDETEASSGLVMGTVKYMSPEQAQGLQVDSRSDIFSFGVVLYEMLAGRPPFEGETSHELIAAILQKEPPTLTGVPDEIKRLVNRALRKEKEERYQTIQDLFADLKRLNGHPSGHITNKNGIMPRLWPDAFVEQANLTSNANSSRNALGDDSQGRQNVESLAKRSYRFVRGRGRRARWMVTVAGLFLLLITGALLIRTRLSPLPKAPLAFQERDWVLIANFDNRTGEPLFDGTIESALERELSNSRFVNVITPERAGDVLKLMKKPPETKIDATVGREMCLRDGGIRALLAGRVERIGTTYLMSVSIVDPFRNQPVAGTTVEAANQEGLWPAIRRLSNWTRETLGERIVDIQPGTEALERVTTPSLGALQLYTQAMALANQMQPGAAEQILRHALVEDPDFASAHIMLAHMIRNQGKPVEAWGPPSQRALDLAERTSDRERYFIEGSYHSIREDGAKAVSAYEALVQQYPDHFWGRNNLAWTYFSLGRYQESMTQFAQAAQLRPNEVWINRMAAWSVLERSIDESRGIVERIGKLITPEMARAHPDEVAWIQLFGVHDLWVRGDIEQALKELDRWAQTLDSREGSERDAFARDIGNCYLAFGKLKAAEEVFQRLPETDGERNIILAENASAAGDRAKFRKHLGNLKPGLGTAFLLARAGFTDEAQKLLTERKKSKSAGTLTSQVLDRILEGEILLSRGRTMEALSLLQQAVPDVRWNSSSWFFIESESLADALDRKGDLQKAVQVLENASREKAIAFENAGSTGSYWLRVQYRLAQAYRKLGRIEDAQKLEAELLNTLAYADPEHPILLQLKQSGTPGNR